MKSLPRQKKSLIEEVAGSSPLDGKFAYLLSLPQISRVRGTPGHTYIQSAPHYPLSLSLPSVGWAHRAINQCSSNPFGAEGLFQAVVVACIFFSKTKCISSPNQKPQRKGNPTGNGILH